MIRSVKKSLCTIFDRSSPPLSGRVEEVVGGDIVGWINPSQSSVPHRLLVTTDLGQRTHFGAHMWHPNADRVIGAPGKYGFAIPVELLPPFKKTVEVTDAGGRLLRNGRMSIPQTARTHERKRFLIVHIPKTAGTSLREFLLRGIRKSTFCAVYDNDPGHLSQSEFASLPEHQKAHFEVIMGHVKPSLSSAMSANTQLITFLRHPLDRLKSHILHRVRTAGASIGSSRGQVPLEMAINEGLVTLADNLQTRTIVELSKQQVPELNERHLQIAKQRIRDEFAFVGLAENGALDIRRLGRLLGVGGFRVPRANIAPATPNHEASRILGAIDWKKVEERHWVDLALLHWVKANPRGIGH